MPYSKVYGVATFYHFFTMKPPGKHTCVVCTGTACYIKGPPCCWTRSQEAAKIKQGETTRDGNCHCLRRAAWVPADLAPAVVFDGQVAGKITIDVQEFAFAPSWRRESETLVVEEPR